MKTQLIYSDLDYEKAVNCEHANYYHPPITANVDNKKYIIGCGTSDNINIVEHDNLVYIIGENSGLDYISMTVIYPENDSVQEVYLEGNDLNDKDCYSYGLLDKGIDEQIKILSEYIN